MWSRNAYKSTRYFKRPTTEVRLTTEVRSSTFVSESCAWKNLAKNMPMDVWKTIIRIIMRFGLLEMTLFKIGCL